MAFKDILVHVDNTPQARERLAVAGLLATTKDAHLVALNVRTRPQVASYMLAQFGPEIIQVQDEINEAAARQTQAMVESVVPSHGITSEWRDVEGDLVDSVRLHARYADITVIGQDEPGDDDQSLADSLVLGVGRPVLVVPAAGKFPSLAERVVVGWNASREATRAVHDALPLLKRAKRVHIIAINPAGGMDGHGDMPGADIGLHLSRHGINAVCEHIRADDISAGDVLLSRAADESADLLVMGAYGRSRLRELVLGGVTHHLLRHMTVPVLFSH